MSIISLLTALKKQLNPPRGAKKRIFSRVTGDIKDPVILHAVHKELSPSETQLSHVWERVCMKISHWEDQHSPSTFFPWLSYRTVRWMAVCVIFLFFVRLVPALLLAPPTVASSAALLIPTKGEVSLSLRSGVWESVAGESMLKEGSLVRTRGGEATLILHDDGVIRLAPFTAVEVHDLTDRPLGSNSPVTVTLIHGKIWVQGLLSPHVSPLTISTSYGNIAVHEGSVSVEEGTAVVVDVWDRRAVVQRNGDWLPLVAGERTWLWEGNIPVVKKIALIDAEAQWNAQNLSRDASHRQDIAKWQHERRADIAGILPTSPLYPVKRVAERIDVLFTLGEESRLQKNLDSAQRRINEAAALIANGIEGTDLISEYQTTVLSLVDPMAEDSLAQMLEDALQESTATIAAVSPGEAGYVLKRAMLEAHAELTALSDADIKEGDSAGILLLDSLSTLLVSLDEKKVSTEAFEELFAALSVLEDHSLDMQADIRKESRTLLSALALRLKAIGGYEDLLTALNPYLPVSNTVIVELTDSEIQQIAERIAQRVLNTFTMKRSRENQLFTEIKALRGHPAQARILRRLHQTFEDQPWYAGYVREEMKNLRESLL
jgi:hypothetical protein